MIPDETKQVDNSRILTTASDRRSGARHKFTALVMLANAQSGKEMKGRLVDLSNQGCHAETTDVFPVGTVVRACITKGSTSFDTEARVVSSQAPGSMGLLFVDVVPKDLTILSKWIEEASENSWVTISRQSNQRVLLQVPVRVSGQNGVEPPFQEETQTLLVSPNGAEILISTAVTKGQRLSLSNLGTESQIECIVAHIGKPHGHRMRVSVAFALRSPEFWHVGFPPSNWSSRHPDAKHK